MEIKNKVVIVTGASSGIGLAVSVLLAKNGARVALVSRSKDKLDSLSKSLEGSLAVQADMANETQIINMIDKVKGHFGRIDILINNAGQGYDAHIENTDIKTFQHILDLDVIGPLIAIQHMIPIMKSQGGGSIINISSGTALMHLPNMAAYSSAKRALSGISLTAREELKKDNIVVSVVYPYITLTDFEKNTIKHSVEEREWHTGNAPKPDTAEFVAEKILEGIKSGEAEIFAHDWMKNRQ